MSEDPTRLAAALEGHYTIERELGEGGNTTSTRTGTGSS